MTYTGLFEVQQTHIRDRHLKCPDTHREELMAGQKGKPALTFCGLMDDALGWRRHRFGGRGVSAASSLRCRHPSAVPSQ
jgi:hypothetical protein